MGIVESSKYPYYAKARKGALKQFTGIDDPYEPPNHPMLHVKTAEVSPEEGAGMILDYLKEKGFI